MWESLLDQAHLLQLFCSSSRTQLPLHDGNHHESRHGPICSQPRPSRAEVAYRAHSTPAGDTIQQARPCTRYRANILEIVHHVYPRYGRLEVFDGIPRPPFVWRDLGRWIGRDGRVARWDIERWAFGAGHLGCSQGVYERSEARRMSDFLAVVKGGDYSSTIQVPSGGFS